MKKLNKEEMKKINGSGVCGPRCECIIAFMDYAGYDFNEAYDECTSLFGRGTS